MGNRTDESAIVKILLEKGSLTSNRIGTELEVSTTSIEHHLKVLIDKGIVKVENKKKYGTTYCIDSKITAIPTWHMIEWTAVFVPLIFGILLYIQYFSYASFWFATASAIVGVAITSKKVFFFKREKLRKILEETAIS